MIRVFLLGVLACLAYVQAARLRRLMDERDSAWRQFDDLEARYIDMRMKAYREGQTA